MDLEKEYESHVIRRKNIITTNSIGTCDRFCPVFEEISRRLRNDISIFESEVLVKKYQRSYAGKERALPEDLRPASVLRETLDYLFSLLTKTADLYQLYLFIADRTRAIRVDISTQGLECDVTIKIYEEIARFHILFTFLLYDNIEFEHFLNTDQLKRSIISLLDLYEKRRKRNFKCNKLTREEQEFYSYYILLNLDDKNLYFTVEKYKEYEIIDECIKMYVAVQQNNIFRIFKLFRNFSFFHSCVFLSPINKIRMHCYSLLFQSLMEKVDVKYVQDMLLMGDLEIDNLFIRDGTIIEDGKINFRIKERKGREIRHIYEKSTVIQNKMPYNLMKSLKIGPIDFFIQKEIFHSFSNKMVITVLQNLKEKKKENYGNISSIYNFMLSEFTLRILNEIIYRKKLRKEKREKKAQKIYSYLFLEYLKKLTFKTLIENGLKEKIFKYLNTWRESANNSMKVKKNEVAIITDKSMFSRVFRDGFINTYFFKTETFNYTEDLNAEDFLSFKFLIFSVKQNDIQNIQNKFYMYDAAINTPTNLKALTKNKKNFIKKIKKAKYIRKTTLFNEIKGMSSTHIKRLIWDIIKSRRNNREVEDKLLKMAEGGKIEDMELYLEQ